MTRTVGVVAAVLVVAGLLWREAVAVGAVQSSPRRRRAVGAAVVALTVVFATSAVLTIAELL